MNKKAIKRVKLIEPISKGRKKKHDDLTPKQRLFVSEFMIDQNQTQAAIRAGFSERSAPIIAHRLLKKANVAEAIERSMSKHLSRADITAERVLTELASVGFSKTDPSLPKPSDKIAALNTLAKHLGLLTEKHEIDQRMSILNVSVSQSDLESARALVENFRSSPPSMIEHEPIASDDTHGSNDEGDEAK